MDEETTAALWQCFEAEQQTHGSSSRDPELLPVPDADIVGVNNMVGVRILRANNVANTTRVETTTLNSESARVWLETVDVISGDEVLISKLLLAEQAMMNDCLQPPAWYGCAELSRRLLARSLKISTRAIAKLGLSTPWAMPFPVGKDLGVSSYGIGAGQIQAIWSHDGETGVNRAFIIWYRMPDRIDHTMQLIQRLRAVGGLPAFVPFLMIDTFVRLSEEDMFTFDEKSRAHARQLETYLYGKEGKETFHESCRRVDWIINIQGYSRAVIEMSTHEIVTTISSRTNFPNEIQSMMEQHQEMLLRIISQRRNELEITINNCEDLVRKTKVQVSSILGLMAFRQQRISLDIAQDTRQDGASMKLLSYLAMLYLPSTAVSTVLAMPLFDWDAQRSSQVTNKRIWIFFIIAIPLTIVTLVSFRYWLEYDAQGEKRTKGQPNTKKKAFPLKKVSFSTFSKLVKLPHLPLPQFSKAANK